MSAYEFRDKVNEAIDKKMGDLATIVVNGTPPSMEAYKLIVGQMKGLSMAREIITETFRKVYEVRKVGLSNDDNSNQAAD